jgi:hypothetical protein
VCDRRPVYRFVIRWPVGRRDLAGIAGRLVREIDGRPPGIVVCDLTTAPAHGAVDAVTVDALARLAVIAQRRDWTLRLEHVPDELVGLIAMMGLTAALLRDQTLRA